jgi:hypothetical protein
MTLWWGLPAVPALLCGREEREEEIRKYTEIYSYDFRHVELFKNT